MDSRLLIGPGIPAPDPTTRAPWCVSPISPHRLMELPPATAAASSATEQPFPTVDVPDHAHYTIGVVILVVGITGMVGNVLVIYAFCRSRSLRTPSNIFIINLAITDLLMCFTQTPTFFLTSMHKRWIFGKKGKSSELLLGALEPEAPPKHREQSSQDCGPLQADLRAKLDPISCRTAAVEQVRAS
ncbi:Melanopsin-A Mammalian-like melanopsin [Takifugu flavidus]|uniref:Melanopsin-A Mammalian-like melanopsin n=1 Tax=Takifugu flavidus TaxID=433684 RepID=A0A5C6PUG4_9TELE|nr:Melanopsin-A Mammalian-like melanopsin [Takifugu flavidus]